MTSEKYYMLSKSAKKEKISFSKKFSKIKFKQTNQCSEGNGTSRIVKLTQNIFEVSFYLDMKFMQDFDATYTKTRT